jgi:hypothetical protein
MLYTDLFIKKPKRVPTILALFSLIFLLGIIGYFFAGIRIPTRASVDYPKQIKFANIGKNRATIFWESGKRETGYILLGESESSINNFYLDDQDTSKSREPRYFHFVSINNLKEETSYYLKIVSGDKVYLNSDNRPFSFKTLKKNSIVYSSKPLYGRVLDQKNAAVDGGIMIFYSQQLPYFITKTKTSGEWLVVLQREGKSFSDDELINVEVYHHTGKKSSLRAQLRDLAPLKEPIILGKNYNFLSDTDNVLSIADEARKRSDVLKFEVIYPQENAVIAGAKPLIKGVALPLKNVDVILYSNVVYSFKTKADEKGNWLVDIKTGLPPGDYQLEAASEDLNNRRITYRRKFRLAKSGETVLGVATPSATLEPTATPQPTEEVVTNTPSPTTIITSPTIYKTGSLDLPIVFYSSLFSILLGIFFILVF